MEEYKGGLCRQFSQFLAYKFNEIGVKIYILNMKETATNNHGGHSAAVWEDKNGNKFVADPLFEDAYETPSYNIPLESYQKILHIDHGHNKFSIWNMTGAFSK